MVTALYIRDGVTAIGLIPVTDGRTAVRLLYDVLLQDSVSAYL